MTKAMVFISTRQLTQVNFTTQHFKDYDLFLIASSQELEQLPSHIAKIFVHQFAVAVTDNDGVIIEYDQREVSNIVDSLKEKYVYMNFICFDEGGVELANYLRQNASDEGELERFRDKIIMKKCLSQGHIATPRFLDVLNDTQDYHDIARTLGARFVVKPKRSAGSNNIYIVCNEIDFIEMRSQINSVLAEFEVEEYIDGDLYHCDIAVWQNKSIFTECTEYLCPTIDFQSGSPLGGKVMDVDSPLRLRLIAFAEKSLSTMKAKDGIYHMEIFVRRDASQSLVFLEVGARPPGMLVTSMYEKATGVNLLNLDILIQTGSSLDSFSFARKQHAFYLVYPKGEGRVESLNTPSKNEELSMLFSTQSTIGDRHKGCSSNLDFCAHVTCSGNDKRLIDQAFTQMSKFKPVNYAN